jgi:cytidyltransferase-like protein
MKKIYVDMVGDLFHRGHVELLRTARALGDCLVVGVLSDEVAATYKRAPIMTMDERIIVIAACRFVDEVIPNAPDIVTSAFLAAHDIALVVHGDDVSDAALATVYADPQREGKLQLVAYTPGVSTSEIIRRIWERQL